MPTSTERGKGKGRGRKRKAAVADVEPENSKTAAAEQHGSPTQSQRYVPKFTTKSKRARVSSSEAVPVTHSETAEDDQEPLTMKESCQSSPPRTQTPIREAELQAAEQVQQTIIEAHGGALDGSSQMHLDGGSCKNSEGSEFDGSVSLVPGLALSQSNISTSAMLQHHHGYDSVGLKETTNGKEIDRQGLHGCNEEIRARRPTIIDCTEGLETGGPPVQIAAGHDGRNLELLDLMRSEDDDDEESEAVRSMKQAMVEVGESLCANAADLANIEAGETAGDTSLQMGAVSEPMRDGRQTDFRVIENNHSQGSLVDITVPTSGQTDRLETLQVGFSSPDATLPDSQDHDLVQEAHESLYNGDGCGSQKKNSFIVMDDEITASLTPRALNGSQSTTAERQLSASIKNTQSSQVPSIVNSSTTGTSVQSHSMSSVSLSPLPTTDSNTSTAAVVALKFTAPCDIKIGAAMETAKAEWEESEASVAVRELMDIAAADLLESQLGYSGDEATVPSCSPASKKPTSKPPSSHPPPWLQRPADPGFTSTAAGSGASSGTQSSNQDEGTGVLRGLIEELSVLNRFIMNCKRELGSARKQRSNWLKSQRGRRGR